MYIFFMVIKYVSCFTPVKTNKAIIEFHAIFLNSTISTDWHITAIALHIPSYPGLLSSQSNVFSASRSNKPDALGVPLRIQT